MAVTGFWPIYKNLKATLDYADNPDKTTDRRYLDDDLYAALSYAENDNKTDRKMYDENDGNTQVFYMKNAVATISSFTSAPVVIKF